MATTDVEQQVRIIQNISEKVEDFSFVWLDANLNTTDDCIETLKRLCLYTNALHTFIDLETYLQLLTQADSFHERFCIIVSGIFSSDLLSVTANLPHVITIVVYCYNTSKYVNEQNANDEKLLRFFDEPDTRFTALNKFISTLRNSLASVSMLTLDTSSQSLKYLAQETAIFVWFHLLFHTFYWLSQTVKARDTMIAECRRFYSNNQAQLDQVNEYAATYKPEEAIKCFDRNLSRVQALPMNGLDSILYEINVNTDVPAALFSNVGEHSYSPGISESFSLDGSLLLDLFETDERKIEIAISASHKNLTTYNEAKDERLPYGDILKIEIFSNVARSHYYNDNYDQAASLFCCAIGLKGSPPTIDIKSIATNLINVGSIAYRKGDIIKALKTYQEVFDLFEGTHVPQLHPALGDIHDRMAILNERLGNMSDAIKQ
ncbi:unnamed protein product [Rotaria magnacalcarata]|uniref:Tetratricopeptide repeat protein n=3 Tax=Rotaria magnacalcarata TaxID=392030 RepID=A0A815SPC9_9BILA|nr:unnamed protein product [Rotaria magnacalcarata]CAF1569618.1 unnamed protein product [Rotaria magnacalcarata]CAF2085341.1 unnamed protein product [Rotaria magnacalcarata]CAF3902766.1 unnamed protein product [Rotaria magnacalcarata]